MKKFKTVFSSTLVIFLLVIAFCGSYCKGYYSYADTPVYMSDAELEAAYQAYLQSKSGGLIGNSGARMTYLNGKLLNYMTSTSNATGITTLDQLKSEMSWEKTQIESGRDVLSLAISPRGLGFLNLYTQWLMQNHYFGNGVNETDGVFNDGTNNTLFSGETWTDDDGNTCFIFVTSYSSSWSQNNSSVDYYSQRITTEGTYLKYSIEQLKNLTDNSQNAVININNNTYNIALYKNTYDPPMYGFNSYPTPSQSFYSNGGRNSTYTNLDMRGGIAVYKYNSRYYLGTICNGKKRGSNNYFSGVNWIADLTNNNNTESGNINFYTNINNDISVYPTINEGDTLYITPKVYNDVSLDFDYYDVEEGDTISNVVNNYYVDSGTPDKTITIPSDELPSNNTPTPGGTLPDWQNPYPNITPDGNGGFNFNFNLPDLNIDWNINGLKEKFPFSIPFDLIAFIRVLDAEPQTPEFTGTINLIIYQWQINADLHAFDNLASIVRNVEFIGFCITLVLITRKMIKG